MTRYLLDSWAWMEYLEGSAEGERVRQRVSDESNEIFTHVVSVAEIVSKVKRRKKDVESAWNAILTNSKMYAVDEAESRDAGLLHASIKSRQPNFGLADAFVLSAARRLGAKVLTGDPDFRGLKGVEMLV
jgi:predicted nucleic acid-binding protein